MSGSTALNAAEQFIDRLFPLLQSTVRREPGRVVVEFLQNSESDYSFSARFYQSGDMSIHADLSDGWQRAIGPYDYFWYNRFVTDDVTPPEQNFRHLHDMLRILLHNDTRIIQARGWFWWSFHCEYNDGGHWRLVSSNTGIRRPDVHVPKIEGRRQVFCARLVDLLDPAC